MLVTIRRNLLLSALGSQLLSSFFHSSSLDCTKHQLTRKVGKVVNSVEDNSEMTTEQKSSPGPREGGYQESGGVKYHKENVRKVVVSSKNFTFSHVQEVAQFSLAGQRCSQSQDTRLGNASP